MFAARGCHGTAVPEVAEAAGVGTGTLYHYFEHKQQLVNEVYRDAKLRLRARAARSARGAGAGRAGRGQGVVPRGVAPAGGVRRGEPDAFRFLEMQDHVEYLDAESRQIELSAVAPLFAVGKRLHDRAGGARAGAARTDVVIALMWGAFVGLVKVGRLGYLRLDAAALEAAGEACWRMVEPEASRAATREKPRRRA